MCGLLGVLGEGLIRHVRGQWPAYSRLLAHRGEVLLAA